jgi:hypothetical protein
LVVYFENAYGVLLVTVPRNAFAKAWHFDATASSRFVVRDVVARELASCEKVREGEKSASSLLGTARPETQ